MLKAIPIRDSIIEKTMDLLELPWDISRSGPTWPDRETERRHR